MFHSNESPCKWACFSVCQEIYLTRVKPRKPIFVQIMCLVFALEIFPTKSQICAHIGFTLAKYLLVILTQYWGAANSLILE